MRALLTLCAVAMLATAAAAQPQYEQRIINGRPVLVPVQPAPPQSPPVVKPATRPGAKPGETVEVEATAKLPTGVRPDKLSPVEKCTVGGVEVDRHACYEMLGAPGSLTDDSRRPVCTVIDSDEARRKGVVAQLKAGLGDKVKIWDGPPTDWSLRPGFVASSEPTIYCQAPDGEVIHRQEGMEGGVEATIEAVRRAVPDYEPRRDPDLRKPSVVDLSRLLGGNNLAAIVTLVVAGGAFWIFTRK